MNKSTDSDENMIAGMSLTENDERLNNFCTAKIVEKASGTVSSCASIPVIEVCLSVVDAILHAAMSTRPACWPSGE